MCTKIDKSTLQFLQSLSKNNNREWFQLHKNKYESALANVMQFIDELLIEMKKHDRLDHPNAKDILMRIYRDTRFSKDKTPYKIYMGGSMQRSSKALRGGYYFHLEPGNTMACGGFFSPNPNDLLRIRKDIEWNYSQWEKLLKNKTLHKSYTELQGERISTCPRGFSKDHPAIELLRHKQFYFQHNFTEEEVLDKDFQKKLNQTFMHLRPFFNYMSEVLTTDLNGQSTI